MKQALSLHPLIVDARVQGLVFDLDGTLIDSARDILQSIRLALEDVGLGTLPDDYFPDNMHGTSMGIFRSVISDMGWEIPEDMTPLRQAYLVHYQALDHRNTRLYPGVPEFLEACRDAGLSIAICTNKMHVFAMNALEKFGLQNTFGFVTGCDTWAEAKPSPIPLLETIRMLELQPAQSVYFGDTSVDAECANSAGVPFVLHESGYGDVALHGQAKLLSFRRWEELMG